MFISVSFLKTMPIHFTDKFDWKHFKATIGIFQLVMTNLSYAFFFNHYGYTHTHTYALINTPIYMFINTWCACVVLLVCLFSGLNTWYWITNQKTYHCRSLILPLPIVINCLYLLPVCGANEIFPSTLASLLLFSLFGCCVDNDVKSWE